MTSLQLRPGSLIVFEGLDRSGKSTQIKRLSALDWAAPGPAFVHMPSGTTDLTRNIYSLTENSQISSVSARQLLHLACHAENIGSIADARARQGLFLDRWWWSTVAYGWYGAGLASSGLSESVFFGLIESVWSAQQADAVFLFLAPHESDGLNKDEVRSGYAALAADHEGITITVPSVSPEETTSFILTSLRAREVLRLVRGRQPVIGDNTYKSHPRKMYHSRDRDSSYQR
jgi:thymidylate kinase